MLIPSGFAQINWKFSGQALPNGAEFTFGFDTDGGSASIAAVAALARDAWEDNFLNYQQSTVSFDSVLVKYGPNATGPSLELTVGVNGGGGGDVVEPQIALLVQKSTALGGRAGRGRFYVPGIAEAATIIGGQVNTTTLATMQADMTAFLGDMNALASGLVLLHSAGAPISTPTPITALNVSPQIATQRRRNRR